MDLQLLGVKFVRQRHRKLRHKPHSNHEAKAVIRELRRCRKTADALLPEIFRHKLPVGDGVLHSQLCSVLVLQGSIVNEVAEQIVGNYASFSALLLHQQGIRDHERIVVRLRRCGHNALIAKLAS